MKVDWKDPADAERLRELIADASNAKQRDRYRQGGIDALVPKRQPGAPPKLTGEQQRQLCAMLDAGPDAQEGLAAYNGPILREKIEERFGKVYSLNGVYALLHRLGYNDLMPRPNHPDTDPAVLDAFKKRVARAAGAN